MVELESAPVVNENLFTNHYLEDRIVNLSEWKEDEEIKEAFDEIKEIYDKKKNILSSCNESQLREEFINPVLRILDFYLVPEESIHHDAKTA